MAVTRRFFGQALVSVVATPAAPIAAMAQAAKNSLTAPVVLAQLRSWQGQRYVRDFVDLAKQVTAGKINDWHINDMYYALQFYKGCRSDGTPSELHQSSPVTELTLADLQKGDTLDQPDTAIAHQFYSECLKPIQQAMKVLNVSPDTTIADFFNRNFKEVLGQAIKGDIEGYLGRNSRTYADALQKHIPAHILPPEKVEAIIKEKINVEAVANLARERRAAKTLYRKQVKKKRKVRAKVVDYGKNVHFTAVSEGGEIHRPTLFKVTVDNQTKLQIKPLQIFLEKIVPGAAWDIAMGQSTAFVKTTNATATEVVRHMCDNLKGIPGQKFYRHATP